MVRKASTSDKLTDTNLEKVIGLLSVEKPITKKAACEILGIAYNTSRLAELIQRYKDKKAYRAEMLAKKRGKPPEVDEITDIVVSYLSGESVSQLAERNFRSAGFVKTIISDTGCPLREPDSSYFKPPLISDDSLKKDYLQGEKCYSARYQSLATVASVSQNKDGDAVYRIWLDSEEWMQFAYQPWWELSSLDKLRTFGVKI